MAVVFHSGRQARSPRHVYSSSGFGALSRHPSIKFAPNWRVGHFVLNLIMSAHADDIDFAARVAAIVSQQLKPDFQQLTTRVDTFAAAFHGIPEQVRANSGMVSKLERDVASIQFQLRTVLSNRNLNIVVFPAKGHELAFQKPAFEHFALPLGLSDATQISQVTRGNKVLVIRCHNPQVKARILKAPNRQKALNVFKVIVKDDLIPVERDEQQQLRPVMDHMYSQGIRAFWDRSVLTFFAQSGKRCVVFPWELQFFTVDELVQIAMDRYRDAGDLADAQPTDVPATQIVFERTPATGANALPVVHTAQVDQADTACAGAALTQHHTASALAQPVVVSTRAQHAGVVTPTPPAVVEPQRPVAPSHAQTEACDVDLRARRGKMPARQTPPKRPGPYDIPSIAKPGRVLRARQLSAMAGATSSLAGGAPSCDSVNPFATLAQQADLN